MTQAIFMNGPVTAAWRQFLRREGALFSFRYNKAAATVKMQ